MECKLEGLELNEAVAAALGWHKCYWSDDGENWDWRSAPTPDDEVGDLMADENWDPSTDWACGGPIIEQNHIYLGFFGYRKGTVPEEEWEAIADAHYGHEGPEGRACYGSTPLIAAMRAFVALETPNVEVTGLRRPYGEGPVDCRVVPR